MPWVKFIAIGTGSVIAYQAVGMPNSFMAELVFGVGFFIALIPFIE